MKYLFIILMITFSYSAYAQSDCDVKLKAISGTYTGECKKGLANGVGKAVGTDQYEGEFKKGLPHGNGIYTWANGNQYEGEFTKGEKEGKGVLTMKTVAGKDSTLTGFWKDDEYIGKYEKPYVIINRGKSISNITVDYLSSHTQAIEVTLKVNGIVKTSPVLNFNTKVGKYGAVHTKARSAVINNVEYPFRANINGLEIEFFKEGYWQITIESN